MISSNKRLCMPVKNVIMVLKQDRGDLEATIFSSVPNQLVGGTVLTLGRK